MPSELDALIALTREIKHYHHTTTRSDNERKKLQSAVAFIFRVAPEFKNKLDEYYLARMADQYHFQTSTADIKKIFQPLKDVRKGLFELLFVQRQVNEADLHSGQVALPGGHLDGEESDFQAVLREVQEEVGIKLMDYKNALYLGKLPKNFYCYPKRGGSLYLNAHVFILMKYNEKNIKLDQKELRDFKWVPFSYFLGGEEKRLKIKRINKLPRSSNTLMNTEAIKNNFVGAEYGAFDIDMDELLWGLTLLLTTYLVMMIKSYQERRPRGSSFKFFEKFIAHSQIFRINFKPGFLWKAPAMLLGHAWYSRNRLQEFSYSEDTAPNSLGKQKLKSIETIRAFKMADRNQAALFEITRKNIEKFSNAAKTFIDEEKLKYNKFCFEKHPNDIEAFTNCRREKGRNLKYHSEFFFIKRSFEEINAQKCFLEVSQNEGNIPRAESLRMFKVCIGEMETNLTKHLKDFLRKFE